MNPVAVYAIQQRTGSHVFEVRSAVGSPGSTSWTTALVDTITIADILPTGMSLANPAAYCARSGTEIVAAVSGVVSILVGVIQISSGWTRFYRSTDEGLTWTMVSQIGGELDIHNASEYYRRWKQCLSLAYYGGTYYAFVYEVDRDFDDAVRYYQKCYKSTDGSSWSDVGTIDTLNVITFDLSSRIIAADSSGVHVCFAHGGQSWYYKSANGVTWTAATDPLTGLAANTPTHLVALDGSLLLAAAPETNYALSLDAGASWNTYNAPEAGYLYPINIVREGNSLYWWGEVYPNVVQYTSTNWTSWTQTYSVAESPYTGVVKSDTDPAGVKGHLICEVHYDGDFYGLVWDTTVPRDTEFWRVASSLTVYTWRVDVCGDWSIGFPYTYFF